MRAVRGTDWSDDTIARLRDLWNEGRSTAEIGRHLGISKNAIIGKAHRLDLPPRKSPIKRGESTRTTPKRPAVPTLAEILPIGPSTPPFAGPRGASSPDPIIARIATAGSRVSPRAGSEPCCWPLGDPGTAGFRFCDDPALVGRPYCEAHARSARRPSGDRPDEARRAPRARDLGGMA